MQTMMNDTHRDMLRSNGILLARMMLGLLFVFSGVGIIMNGPTNSAAYFASEGVPLASLVVYAVILLKVTAGGALIVGYRIGLASLALIGFTASATLVAHMDLNDMNLFKNMAIIGGLLYAMTYGPGEGWKLEKAPEPSVQPLQSTSAL